MKELIITHPGSAHFDEFFAISLLLASHETKKFRIERREPSVSEIQNPDIWVIDIGEEHNPSLKNFDHHQNIKTNASFVLIADYLGLTKTLSLLPWWNFKDRIDRFGPVKIGAELGTDKLRTTYSPFEGYFLNRFSESPNSVMDHMNAFAKSIINEAKQISDQIKFWSGCEVITIKNRKIIIGETTDSDGAQIFNDQTGGQLSVFITHDNRGEGWKLCRFDNAPDINFALLSGLPEIKFAHKTGFVAKTLSRLSIDDVLKLIQKAIP